SRRVVSTRSERRRGSFSAGWIAPRNGSRSSSPIGSTSRMIVLLRSRVRVAKRLTGPSEQGLDRFRCFLPALCDLIDALLLEVLGAQNRLVTLRQSGQRASNA